MDQLSLLRNALHKILIKYEGKQITLLKLKKKAVEYAITDGYRSAGNTDKIRFYKLIEIKFRELHHIKEKILEIIKNF